jgi:hypothetical protein
MASQTKKQRKTYQKPQVERVRLVVEEAVLAGCKIGGVTQPGYLNCFQGTSYCNTIGTS